MTIWDYLTKGIPQDNIRKDDDGLTTLYVPKPEHEMGGTELSMWDMHLPGTKTLNNETAVMKLSDDVIERMKKSQIRLPKGGIKEMDLLEPKWPYYMIRGKSIEQDQVKMILKEELPLFPNKQCAESPCGRLYTETIGYVLSKEYHFGGWLWDTGEIGGNMYSEIEFPEYYDFMPRWIKLALKYPFLDMVIAYTNYDQLPCYLCPVALYYDSWLAVDNYKRKGNEELAHKCLMIAKKYKAVIDGTWDDGTWNDSDNDWSWWQFPCRRELIGECSDHFKILHDYRWSVGKDSKQDYDAEYFWIVDVPQIYMDVVLTLRIKDGNIDVITGDEAKQVFKDYNERYHFADPRRYSYMAEEFFEKARIGEKMLKECMEECGMDVEKSMQALAEKDDIKLEWM
ncbi:MAG: hypothetical protein K5889_02455 [Lachnospiraceae bacterium]|nr:hypothetical protein [Lachnospiraceae bacterium]